MTETQRAALKGLRVLVAEDEPLLALDLSEELKAAGAVVVGPADSMDAALKLLEVELIDAAVLDIFLGTEAIFPVADALTARGVPFIFATGCDADMIPAEHAHVPRCDKPVPADGVLAILSGSAEKLVRGSS